MELDRKAYAAKARELAAAGSVLLQNENQTLPFEQGSRIAVFGRSQLHYHKSGIGSGGMVHTKRVPTIVEALEDSGSVTVDQKLKAVYEGWVKTHPYHKGVGWATEPWSQTEMPLTADLVGQAAEENDGAVILLARLAGESRDLAAVAGGYYLTDGEREMLKAVCKAFERVAVVLNTGNIMDMSWVGEYHPGAVLYVWQGGQEGSRSTADILTGKTPPTGKLADTIAKSMDDYPATGQYGDPKRNIYREDIYLGYRYFETFAPDRVAYPFGYGLTYTTFEIDDLSATRQGERLHFSARVTNTGSAASKETVQVYCEAPQGKLGKASRVLVAFLKTKTLKSGESSVIEMSCPLSACASYDDSGATGHRSCWVLEAGEYRFYIGADVKSAGYAGSVTFPETVLEVLEEACAPVTAFDRLKTGEKKAGGYQKAYEPAPLQTVDPMSRRVGHLPAARPSTGDLGYRLRDVAAGKVPLSAFVDQLSDKDLTCLVRGEGMCSPKVTPGSAGAFGGVTKRLQEFGIPIACCTDGPSGIRLDCGTIAFSLPSATCQACSFDTELVKELYGYTALELRQNQIDTLLGPGMNLHRHPLCGRNFEYYSEDPLLTGKMAAAELSGMHNHGVTGTVKHFACNNQEHHRHDAESVLSERALRELYLKGFEIAVKEGGAYSVMTSYNPVNGWWSASNYDLLTTILRQEWGYTGLVMTDWWAKGNDTGKAGSRTNIAAMIRAQNDLYMVTVSAGLNTHRDNSKKALASGSVTRGEYLRAAENICRFLMRSPCMQGRKKITVAAAFGDSEDQIRHAKSNGVTPAVLDLSGFGSEKGESVVFAVTLQKRGRHLLRMVLQSESPDDLAQLPLSIFQGTELLGSVTLSGRERKGKTVEFELFANGTVYLRFFVAEAGLHIHSCEIIP